MNLLVMDYSHESKERIDFASQCHGTLEVALAIASEDQAAWSMLTDDQDGQLAVTHANQQLLEFAQSAVPDESDLSIRIPTDTSEEPSLDRADVDHVWCPRSLRESRILGHTNTKTLTELAETLDSTVTVLERLPKNTHQIVIPIDFKRPAGKALRFAAARAEELSCELIVANMIDPETDTTLSQATDPWASRKTIRSREERIARLMHEMEINARPAVFFSTVETVFRQVAMTQPETEFVVPTRFDTGTCCVQKLVDHIPATFHFVPSV